MTPIPGVAGSVPAASGLAFRAIRPDDASALQRFHLRLSPGTVRNRFFGAHSRLGDGEARRFTSLAPDQQVALVATVGDRIVGVGRYIRLGAAEAAEVAFVVEDTYQGRGIGRELLSLLGRIGWDDDIKRFVADTFADNHAMLAVFRRTPHAVRVQETRRDGSVIHLVMGVTRPRSDLIAIPV